MDIRQLSNPELLWRNGIFSKNMLCESYIPALLCVLNSKTDLTPEFTGRELKVLDLLLDGKSASVVSEKMHLSVKTISSLKVKALRKLGLHNANTQALIIYGKYRQIQKHRHLLNHFSEKNI